MKKAIADLIIIGVVILCLSFGGIYFLRHLGPPVATPVVTADALPSPSPTPIPTVAGQDRVVSFWLKESIGHGCPVSATEALTAEHVVTTPIDGGFRTSLAIWGDGLGNTGTVTWKWSDIRRDISMVETVKGTSPFNGYFHVAKSEPQPGDAVYIVGFNYKNRIEDYLVKAKVLGSQAGVLIYDSTPGPGSSGSCVLNSHGEVVAINSAMINDRGLGLLVTGDWLDIPAEFLITGVQ